MFAPDFVVFISLCVLCTAVSRGTNEDSVESMQIVEDIDVQIKEVMESTVTVNDTHVYSYKNVKLLQFMRDNFKSVPWNTRTQVNSFKWQNCGSSSDLLVVNGLSVTPDPLSLPGSVGLKFDVTVQETFTSPLKLAIELKKYEGFFWLTIPCIDQMGSCTYDDICQKLAGVTCPKEFGAKIPCKCPFTKGSYSLPSSSFSVPAHVPSGKYFVQAKLSDGSKAVNCIEIYFNIA